MMMVLVLTEEEETRDFQDILGPYDITSSRDCSRTTISKISIGN